MSMTLKLTAAAFALAVAGTASLTAAEARPMHIRHGFHGPHHLTLPPHHRPHRPWRPHRWGGGIIIGSTIGMPLVSSYAEPTRVCEMRERFSRSGRYLGTFRVCRIVYG